MSHLDVLLKAAPCSITRYIKADPRWNLSIHHVRREYGIQSPREKLWIRSTLACSLRAYVWECKADINLKKIWRKKVLRNPFEFNGAERVTFSLPEHCRISTPIQYSWIDYRG